MVSHLLAQQSEQLVELLLSWFRTTKRDLPWRRTYDPYHVWISEIMLQQTQMERGVRYFNAWIERFPTAVHVAGASEDEILQQWEGLGYYSRARNLHKAARIICERFQGVVPSDYATLLTLPGVGPYTAAAIASIAGNQDVAVVDANVNRLFARLFNIETAIKEREAQKQVKTFAEKLLPRGRARQFNQALMDFGGLVCTPKKPLCDTCPISSFCAAKRLAMVDQRPVLKKPKESVSIHRVAGLIVHNGKIYMQKRAATAVWGGLWEFPGGEAVVEKEGAGALDVYTEIKKDTHLEVQVTDALVPVKHQFTHHKVTLNCYLCRLRENSAPPQPQSASSFRWLWPKQMDELACPSGVRKIIDHVKKRYPSWFVDNFATL